MATKKDYKEIGLLIRDFRHSKGWSSEEFAREIGMSYPTISRIENGHHGPSAILLQKLAEAGMDISEISAASRSFSKEQTLSYRLAEVENRLVKMEDTIKQLLALLKEKE